VKSSGSLGDSSSGQIGIGSVVRWKRLGKEENLGMVYELYTAKMGGRQVKKAKVASFRNATHYDLLLIELKLVTKGLPQ